MSQGRLRRLLKLEELNFMRITPLLVLNGVYMLGHLVVSTRGQQLPFEKSYMWTTESECSLWYFDYGEEEHPDVCRIRFRRKEPHGLLFKYA